MTDTPHSLELERTVLASCLVGGDALALCLQAGLCAADFHATAHRHIYTAMVELQLTGAEIDTVAVSDVLSRAGHGEALIGILDAAQTARPQDLVDSLQDYRRRRTGIDAAQRILRGLQDTADPDVCDTAVQTLTEALGLSETARTAPVDAIVPVVMHAMDMAHTGGRVGLSTGFTDLDAKIGGLMPGDLYILAGRPAMGKTAAALQIAAHVARDHRVLVFSAEMAREQVIQRLISTTARVSLWGLRAGTLKQSDMAEVGAVVGDIRALRLWVDDKAAPSLSYMRAVMTTVRPELVVLDYLQLCDGNRKPGDSRNDEIGGLSRGTKELAKSFGVPVVALSQLSRAVEQRGGDRKPQLSDLRESGSIEQDADVVMFVYRKEYYYPQDSESRGKGQIIIGKQRNGPVGEVHLQWDGNTASYRNLAVDVPDVF